MRKRGFWLGGLARHAAPAIGLAVFLVAGLAIHHAFRRLDYQELRSALSAVPAGRVLGAGLLTVLSYLVLTLYDVLAFRYARVSLPYGQLALTSFLGYAFSNSVGYSFLSGGAIRYRMYSSWGIESSQIARIIAFCTVTGWLGFAVLGGAACFAEPSGAFPAAFPARLHIPLGIGLLGSAAVYLGLNFQAGKTLQWRTRELTLPGLRIAAAQVLVGVTDLTVASCVFYSLLVFDTPVSFLSFTGFFMIALLTGLVSQVPGGLGVFETVLLSFLTPYAPLARILSALIVFRIVYYFVPLLVAVAVLGGNELYQRRAALQRVSGALRALSPAVPDVFAWVTFAGGVVLLLSGVTPPVRGRMAILRDVVPLPLVEASHFLASVAGVTMILIGRALQRRVDAAYWAAVGLLGAGAVFSLLKGLDYEEAAVLTVILIALLPCRREFYRKGSLLAPRWGVRWIGAVAAVLVSMAWLGFFAHRHVEYSSELWWRFTFSSSAPRALRAAVGAGVLAAAFALTRLFRPAPAAAPSSNGRPGPDVEALVYASSKAYAFLAFLGDKLFLVNPDRSGFIMYGLAGRCAVALGDPVAAGETVARDLIWRFRDLCDRLGALPVFYQVAAENLYLYADIGLMATKFGEEARVGLPSFTMAGAAYRNERHVLHKMEREGLEFSIVPREAVPGLLSELQAVSDDWLRHKNTREKGFSLGYFDPDYLCRFRHALLRVQGRMVAFANVLETGDKGELSVDLMRYVSDAPSETMDALFLSLMQWGRQEGFAAFNLGMVPLAGLEPRKTSPLWNRFASLAYEHGERFYNFQGLRQYKDKFRPEWRPKYIASPGGIAFPHVLAGIAALVNRGVTGIVAR